LPSIAARGGARRTASSSAPSVFPSAGCGGAGAAFPWQRVCIPWPGHTDTHGGRPWPAGTRHLQGIAGTPGGNCGRSRTMPLERTLSLATRFLEEVRMDVGRAALEQVIERARLRSTRGTEMFIDGDLVRGRYDSVCAKAEADIASAETEFATLGAPVASTTCVRSASRRRARRSSPSRATRSTASASSRCSTTS
jgi:hypothetical protein